MNKSSPNGGKFHLGTVSHGTLRAQDLLRSFASEYERLVPFNSASLVYDAREYADKIDAYEEGDHDASDMRGADLYAAASSVVSELLDALDNIAYREGPYYFGTHEGDGADFGFWPTEDASDE